MISPTRTSAEFLPGARTPCALVDLPVLERNCSAMRERAARMGVVLRPHVKTHKCVSIARLQHGGTLGPVTVSTMAEARAFAEAGFRDLTYAVPVPFDALPEAADLTARGIVLNLLLDSEAALLEVEACAAARQVVFPVFLKVDCGYHRAGVDPASEGAERLASELARSPHVRFRGLLTHSGQAYRCRNREEARAVAEHERAVMAGFAERLRAEDMAVPKVSVGSTPACCAVERYDGVTEIRPGNYVFFDAFQAAIGTCTNEDARAFTVLASVVGSYPERGELVVNAGALALSKDEGPVLVDRSCGYGVLLSIEGAPLPGLKLASLSQEHGLVRGEDRAAVERLPVGSRVRIVPNHSCLAAACFDRYHVLRGGEIVEEWPTCRGW